MATSSSLAAKLRTDFASSGSRSGTPESSSDSPGKPREQGKQNSLLPRERLAGMKRKVETDDELVERTPPLKKLAPVTSVVS